MRTQWTEEKIERDLREAAKEIGHFPSVAELNATNRNGLSCAIGRNGGFIVWARRLGMDRGFSDSDFGWAGEVKVANIFTDEGHDCVRSSAVKAPFDLVVDGVLRVDVKTANFASYGYSTGWFYRIGKIPQADLILLYQADTGDFYGLPWHACPTSNVTISRGGGKYADYINNWPLIRSMIGMRMAERAQHGSMAVAEVA
jgi:hypothetical protein